MHMALPTVLGFADRKKERETWSVKKREQQLTKGFFGQSLGAILERHELG